MSDAPSISILLPLRRPLLTTWTTCILLDCKNDELHIKIESGVLPFVWDIRSAIATQPFLRVLASSVLQIQKNGKAISNLELSAVIDATMPHHRPILRATELARMFSCDQGHVTNLILGGLLVEDGRQSRSNETRRVTRVSLIRFLTARRVA